MTGVREDLPPSGQMALSPQGGENGARGEAVAWLAGQDRRLCLTLGALAEIETALGLPGVEALAERMRALSANDLMVVLGVVVLEGSSAGFSSR